LQAWLAAAGITAGKGRRGDGAPAQFVADIVKFYAERVGLDPTLFAGQDMAARSFDRIR
jgi:hypothetical protein